MCIVSYEIVVKMNTEVVFKMYKKKKKKRLEITTKILIIIIIPLRHTIIKKIKIVNSTRLNS